MDKILHQLGWSDDTILYLMLWAMVKIPNEFLMINLVGKGENDSFHALISVEW